MPRSTRGTRNGDKRTIARPDATWQLQQASQKYTRALGPTPPEHRSALRAAFEAGAAWQKKQR